MIQTCPYDSSNDERIGLDVWERMLLMWDSHNFDAEGGYKPLNKSLEKWGLDSEDWQESMD